jgi:hypothetical protein
MSSCHHPTHCTNLSGSLKYLAGALQCVAHTGMYSILRRFVSTSPRRFGDNDPGSMPMNQKRGIGRHELVYQPWRTVFAYFFPSPIQLRPASNESVPSLRRRLRQRQPLFFLIHLHQLHIRTYLTMSHQRPVRSWTTSLELLLPDRYLSNSPSMSPAQLRSPFRGDRCVTFDAQFSAYADLPTTQTR